jgi:hypothetical protein
MESIMFSINFSKQNAKQGPFSFSPVLHASAILDVTLNTGKVLMFGLDKYKL